MTIIGITGPTGAGKTTALNELVKLGGCIYDADAVYHDLLKSSTALRRELEDRFGPLTDEQGEFQRKKLGAIVFADPEALADLNAISHRYVVAAIQEQLHKGQTCFHVSTFTDGGDMLGNSDTGSFGSGDPIDGAGDGILRLCRIYMPPIGMKPHIIGCGQGVGKGPLGIIAEDTVVGCGEEAPFL